MPLVHPLPNDGRTRLCVVCWPNVQRPGVSMTYHGLAVCAQHETLTPAEIQAAAANKP
jgi:hypothetical protein